VLETKRSRWRVVAVVVRWAGGGPEIDAD